MKFTVALLIARLAFPSIVAAQPSVTPAPAADWTIMVYMNGDNNLDSDAIRNFRQIASVALGNRVKVLVQFDRPQRPSTPPVWSQTLRFEMRPGIQPVPAQAAQDLKEQDMGNPATLLSFVQWAKKRAPASRYAVIIWGHGQGYRLMQMLDAFKVMEARANRPSNDRIAPLGAPMSSSSAVSRRFPSDPPTQGPVRSVSSDDTNQSKLYNREIQEVLANQGVDLIGFDACLMGMIETAYAMRHVAKVMVASEELEPGFGWNYRDFLTRLVARPQMDARGLGTAIVDSYENEYAGQDAATGGTTLSALDLAHVQATVTAVSLFADALIPALQANLPAVVAARKSCNEYAPNTFGDGLNYFHHIDLGCVARELGMRIPSAEAASRDVIAAVGSLAYRNYASPARLGAFGSTGIAIYFPVSNSAYVTDLYAENGYERMNQNRPVEFVQDPAIHWADFLHAYFSKVP